ncbi:uncharacterized protein LOC121411452 [Lytechinus variegatus]|uniref:uncharacterized protein LOC121411452 n=1 Tax=Lytechinus variegatus TaxID=7654 RepID=UPI001BB24BF5|nr:uncharacterized protein LOC121411452 [Lytechinus variegatus]
MDTNIFIKITFSWIITFVIMTSSVQESEGTCTVPSYSFPLNTTSPNYCAAGSEVEPFTECTYDCDQTGYILDGEATTTCLIVGTFSSNPPTCRDIESPTISCQDNITTSTDPGLNYATVIIADPVVADNSGDIKLNLPDSYRVFIGVSVVRFEAVDDGGNSAACSVFVTVEDTEPPSLTCPGTLNVTNDPGLNYAVVTWDDIEIEDNSGQFVSNGPSYPSGTKFPIGQTTVQVSASDLSSNIGTCSFVVVVRDVEPPTLICAEDFTTTTDPGAFYADVMITPPTVQDNSNPLINQSEAYPVRLVIGSSAITFSAKDGAGNLAECTVVITVLDVEPPELMCPDDIVVSAQPNQDTTAVLWAEPTATDNSQNPVSTPIGDFPSGSIFSIGTTPVTYTASDVYGNIGSCVLQVTVRDYDECETVFNQCNGNAECTNTPGGYTCQCDAGYSGDGFTCLEIDECTTNDHNCDSNAGCVNTDGSFECQCMDGYSGDGFTCQDINECDLDLSECHPLAECNNTIGSYTCTCLSGYTGNGILCTNIDECTTGDHGCDINADCVDSDGSFECQCRDGYTGNGTTCTDINECTSGDSNCDENAECTNTDGSFVCQCVTGFSGDGNTCDDIDECSLVQDICDENAECTNTDGSFVCECLTGFTGDGTTCDDDNECISDEHDCDDNAECFNTDGSFICECLPGFSGDGIQCEDIDECSSGEDDCDENAECINTDGSFICECLPGYSGNGTSCGAFDICETLTPCPSVAECINEIDSYTCQCRSGYETVTVSTGVDGSVVCGDVDECSSSITDCDVNAVCVNTVGSYECVCGDGYAGDGISCEAVDSCLSSPCQNGGVCTSGDNSYQCECPSDFTGINCNTEVVQNEPIEVIEHPSSQEIEYGNSISLSCAFQNAESFTWKKSEQLLLDSTDRSPLVISPALPRDQGYYSCIGYGENGEELETDAALVTMTGVTNYIVTASFDLTYEDTLADPNSDLFVETAATIQNFVNIGLQNTAGFSSPPEAKVNALTSGSVIAEIVIFVTNGTSDEVGQLSLVETALLSQAESSDGFMDPSSVSVMSTVTCPFLTWMSPYGAVNFTTGPVDSEALSTGLCPSYKLNHGQPIGKALCVGDGLSPSYWDPVDNCGRNLTADEQLILLEETPVTIDNVADIAESTSELTSSSESLTSDGVASVSRLLEDIAEARSPEPAVCGFVIETVQNILSASPDELAGAQTESGATSRAVASLEEQLFIVDISASNGTYRRVEENLAVEVVELSPETLRSGLSASLTVSGGSDKIAADDFKLLVGEETDVDDEPDALLDLPPEIGDVISAGDNVRCSFTTFADPALFQSPSLAVNENSTGPYRTANSPVISATVGGSVINGLTQPVVVSFKPLNPNATNATCVFWDFEANNGTGDWSTEGCRLSNTSTDSRPVCQCDHLTNFAVLMDIYGGSTLSDREDFILEILSYVGCSMSVFGLVITIITYLSNRKFRMKNPNQILLCLCFSLLGLYVTFLTMIALDAERGVVEVGVIPCSIVAGLLHFFTLSSLAWMCVEGFNMYLMFVRVVDSYVSNFILKASFCAWGLPAVVVFITAGVTRDTYAQTDFCFVSLWPQVGGLLIPIGLILLFNIVVFALVMKRLTKTVRGKQQNEKAERRQRIRRFQNAISILLLMGLTWSVGYLSLIQATSVVVQGIFTVLNSLQGYFIFMLYCVRQPQVRRQWRAQFSCCLPESLRVSLDSSTSRFSSTVNTRTTTTWKPNNQPSKKGLNTVSKFNPNSVPTSTTENLGSRMYNDRI